MEKIKSQLINLNYTIANLWCEEDVNMIFYEGNRLDFFRWFFFQLNDNPENETVSNYIILIVEYGFGAKKDCNKLFSKPTVSLRKHPEAIKILQNMLSFLETYNEIQTENNKKNLSIPNTNDLFNLNDLLQECSTNFSQSSDLSDGDIQSLIKENEKIETILKNESLQSENLNRRSKPFVNDVSFPPGLCLEVKQLCQKLEKLPPAERLQENSCIDDTMNTFMKNQVNYCDLLDKIDSLTIKAVRDEFQCNKHSSDLLQKHIDVLNSVEHNDDLSFDGKTLVPTNIN